MVHFLNIDVHTCGPWLNGQVCIFMYYERIELNNQKYLFKIILIDRKIDVTSSNIIFFSFLKFYLYFKHFVINFRYNILQIIIRFKNNNFSKNVAHKFKYALKQLMIFLRILFPQTLI